MDSNFKPRGEKETETQTRAYTPQTLVIMTDRPQAGVRARRHGEKGASSFAGQEVCIGAKEGEGEGVRICVALASGVGPQWVGLSGSRRATAQTPTL